MPTIKQKQAFMKVVKGSPIRKAMREVGYSPKTALKTNKLTDSDGWKELLDKYLPEKKLLKVGAEGLEATKSDVQMIGRGESELVKVPDYAVRHKYYETGLKLRARLNPETSPGTTNLTLTQIVINPPHDRETRDQSNGETVPGLASPTES